MSGQVQGVGFRPYVYRLARALGLTGFVGNDAGGAFLEVQGEGGQVEAFADRLVRELPPLALVRQCRREPVPPVAGERGFEIRPSAGGEMADAQVTVDTATCPDCLRELFDAGDPRYRYPFINCTNCGPRYSIIGRIPYDRPHTTMADFAMCRLCASQYADPLDRRFHAQPIACPTCGPTAWLVDVRGKQIVCDDPVARAAEFLRRGRIVAVKGLVGFHLACRADDDHAVRRLRRRKGRDAKPFALMVADIAQARTLCAIDPAAEELLTGPQRPILLLPRVAGAPVAPSVAPGLDTLGIMLPYTPLHHLLFACGLPPVVATSGNVSDEPLVKDNADAIAHLGRIADAFLLHNRRIERSIDDSVVQFHPAGPPVVLRRARGYAPMPIVLGAQRSPAVLAVGGELKNAVCLYQDGRAVLSEHVGDLKDGRVYRHFMQVINDLEVLFDFQPEVLAADLHPQYLSTEYALRRSRGQLAGRAAIPLVRVQHHHAHVVACLAENGREGEVIGLACDGTGYGTDGAIWGCEVLRASAEAFQRLGRLRYYPSPGGDAAAMETIRPAMSLLVETFGPEAAKMPIVARLCRDAQRAAALAQQLAAGVNCPPTSSLGRLFDAVSGLCGLAEANRFEGEAPMLLEVAAAMDTDDEYPFVLSDASPFEIDPRPMLERLVADLMGGADVSVVAAKFHNTVAAFLAAAAERARELTGLNVVALTGGCFANRRLRRRLVERLAGLGFEVLLHRQIPTSDGGVALGQAIVAARKSAVARKNGSAQASSPSRSS